MEYKNQIEYKVYMHYLQILSRKREVRNLHIKFRLIKH